MRLRLSAEDRERLGCPEFLHMEPNRVDVREAITLQHLGYPTPALWVKALNTEEKRVEATIALVWMALRRAGIKADPDTLDFNYLGLEVHPDEGDAEPKVEPGKATARGGSKNSTRTS